MAVSLKATSALSAIANVRIPPAAHTYQSDVETVRRLEDEFFDLEDFSAAATSWQVHYQLCFNLVRPNSPKKIRARGKLSNVAPDRPSKLCLLPPVFLDYYLNDSGDYDVR